MIPLRRGAWLISALMPRVFSGLLAMVALVWLLACTIAIPVIIGDVRNPVGMIGATAFVGGVPAFLVLLVAAALAGSWASAAPLLVIDTAVGGYVAVAVGLGSGSTSGDDGYFFGMLVFGVPLALATALLAGLPALVATGLGARRLKKSWRELQEERALAILVRRGGLAIDKLAALICLDPGSTRALVEALPDRLVWDGDLVWRTGWLEDRESLLQGTVQARGTVHRTDLGEALGLQPAMLRRFLQLAARRGELTGYLDWEEGVLYARSAEVLRAEQRCPRCGGDLRVEGHGVVQCSSCEAEIFV